MAGTDASGAPGESSIAGLRSRMILRRRPVGRSAGAFAVLGVAALMAGCGLSAGPNEYVVHFAPGTSVDQARLVGKACPGVGKATLEPPARNNLATSRAYPVRYDITHASAADKSALTKCLQQYSIVRGISESNDDA